MTLDMGHGTYDMGAGQERDIYLFFIYHYSLGNTRRYLLQELLFRTRGETNGHRAMCKRGVGDKTEEVTLQLHLKVI